MEQRKRIWVQGGGSGQVATCTLHVATVENSMVVIKTVSLFCHVLVVLLIPGAYPGGRKGRTPPGWQKREERKGEEEEEGKEKRKRKRKKRERGKE